MYNDNYHNNGRSQMKNKVNLSDKELNLLEDVQPKQNPFYFTMLSTKKKLKGAYET